MDGRTRFEIKVNRKIVSRQLELILIKQSWDLVPWITYTFLEAIHLFVRFIVMLFAFLTLSCPRGSPLRVKSSGIRQSKICKCHECAYGPERVNGIIVFDV